MKLMGWTQGLFWRCAQPLLFNSILISVAAGYAMAKLCFPGRNVSMAMIMQACLAPVALLMIPCTYLSIILD